MVRSVNASLETEHSFICLPHTRNTSAKCFLFNVVIFHLPAELCQPLLPTTGDPVKCWCFALRVRLWPQGLLLTHIWRCRPSKQLVFSLISTQQDRRPARMSASASINADKAFWNQMEGGRGGGGWLKVGAVAYPQICLGLTERERKYGFGLIRAEAAWVCWSSVMISFWFQT